MWRRWLLGAVLAGLGLGPALAQTTPNLNLNIPSVGTPGWGTLMNQNFSNLDLFLSGGTPLPGTLNAATASALLNAPTLCPSGYAPQGILDSGDATGCTLISSGTGLPSAIAYVPPGSTSSAIQTILSAASSGEEIWFSGTSSGCSLTLTVGNVRVRGLVTDGTVIQCATPGVPVLTLSGAGDEISGIKLTHITNSPTCPGGNGTSTCGDGLQVAGGASRVKIKDVHTPFNYNGLALGYTTYSEVADSVTEFNNNHGVAFVMDPTHKTMQWQVSGLLSEQNLGNGFDMTCPASFTSVQSTAPSFAGWTQTFGNAGYGFNFSCSAATTSGIADVWMSGVFSSQNNKSGFRFDLGPNGGRNAILNNVYSEQAGTYTGTAGFASATQSATNAGYGIEITSSCDNTPAPVVTGGVMWGNSYSGILAGCPGTSISNVSTDFNGRAALSAQTEAGVTINATNVQVHGGFHKAETYGTYLLGGDTPDIEAPVCDSSITSANCVFSGTQPTNGFQQWIGQVKYISGNGVPTMNCGVGWNYDNIAASSASTVHYICFPANTWTAVTVP